jgi:hypothetical protein
VILQSVAIEEKKRRCGKPGGEFGGAEDLRKGQGQEIRRKGVSLLLPCEAGTNEPLEFSRNFGKFTPLIRNSLEIISLWALVSQYFSTTMSGDMWKGV